MSDKPKYWSIKRTLTLAEAAVLLAGEDPDKWPASKLTHDRPYGFTPIFDTMMEDARNIEGERLAIEGEGTAIEKRDSVVHYTEYTLMTYEPLYLDKRTEHEWLLTKADTTEIVRWVKAQRDRVPVKLDLSLLVDNSSTEVEDGEETPRPRTENNYLRLIMKLANVGIKDFNPQKPYEAAQLIIDEIDDLDLSKQTIAGYIIAAYKLESKSRD